MNVTIPLVNNPAPHNQSKTNRYGGVYKSKRELAYITELETAINELHIQERYTEQYLTVCYTFGIKPPKSWSIKKTNQALNGTIMPTNKNVGDVDNIVKSTQDVLMRTNIIDDDSNIVNLSATKIYSPEPFVQIEVQQYEPEPITRTL
ncbi:RusA family crossover junction endodeoxyribonuclease [Leuconostoc citreum]|uniref:RusA family crossover junction endodeoxyribonuclease n=1 Tax=Leuconostoc citreum TaxID=33964 RepID=UPI002150E2CF|nr:RusA family crossover junction endodeoxyribonuclease [Leuconostoc citreum]